MNKQLFPKEIIENSQEANFSRHSLSSKVIYVTTLIFIGGVFCLLPFIKVDVGVRSHGLIRPVTELIQLTSPVSGFIQTLNHHENSYIKQDDIFAILEAPQITEKMRFIEARQLQLNAFLNDLWILQKIDSLNVITPVNLKSPHYQSVYLEFRQKWLKQQLERNQQKRIFDRNKALFDNDIISKAAMDESRFSFQTTIRQEKLLLEQQQNLWKLDEMTFQDELDNLKSEYIQLQDELKRYEIKAPITGTVQNLAGIFPNSYIYTNQVLAEVSPDTSLIADVYILPRDIGLLQEGMPVRLQIEAYNYNQWGFITGKVQEISPDVTMNDKYHFFKVRCTLDQTFLELPNGFRGELKKGMTFQARFIVNRRSLFQLLYDKVDDWLNPTMGENEFTVQKLNP